MPETPRYLLRVKGDAQGAAKNWQKYTGIGSKENIEKVKPLAEAVHGEIAGSRPVCLDCIENTIPTSFPLWAVLEYSAIMVELVA